MLTIKHKKVNPLQFVSLKKNVEGAKYKINIKFDLRECDNVLKDDNGHSIYMIKLIPLTEEVLQKSYTSKNYLATFISSKLSQYKISEYGKNIDYLILHNYSRDRVRSGLPTTRHTLRYNINMVKDVNKKLKDYLKSNKTISKINNAKITNNAIGLGYNDSWCSDNIEIRDDYVYIRIKTLNECNISITTSNRDIANTVENIISIIQEELHKVLPNIKVTCGDIIEESVYSFYEDNKDMYYKFLNHIEDSNIKIVERFDVYNKNESYLYNIIAKTKNQKLLSELVPVKTYNSLSKSFENTVLSRYISHNNNCISINTRHIIVDYDDINVSMCYNLILQTNDIKQIKKAKLMLSNDLDITCYTPCDAFLTSIINC